MNVLGQPGPDDQVKRVPDHQIGSFWANVKPSFYEHLELLQPCCHDNEYYIPLAAHCLGPGRETIGLAIAGGWGGLGFSEVIS